MFEYLCSQPLAYNIYFRVDSDHTAKKEMSFISIFVLFSSANV